jgi:hypothetical protein
MMSEVPPPDWAALYQQHRDAMYRAAAARVLRGAGRADEAGDAVSAAMESLMKSPPANVLNWQAVRGAASAAPRRSIASLPSANFRRKASRARPARPSGHSGSDRGRGREYSMQAGVGLSYPRGSAASTWAASLLRGKSVPLPGRPSSLTLPLLELLVTRAPKWESASAATRSSRSPPPGPSFGEWYGRLERYFNPSRPSAC